MRKSKFSESQIMDALKRAEAGLAVPEVCRELDISSATFIFNQMLICSARP